MNYKVIHTKLGIIEYTSIGNGIPILFLHGGHSNCYDTLCHKGFDLERFQLITPSRPGYGKTTLKGNRTPKQAADLVVELLKHLSIENVIVYGVSAGGLTAIELASNYPTKVKKLILASAVSKKWLHKKDRLYKAARVLFNPYTERFVWGVVGVFSRIFPVAMSSRLFPQFSTKAVSNLRMEDISELFLSMKNYSSKHGFLNDIKQKINQAIITNIKCPTLIIHSKNDASVALEHALYANTKIKSSKLEIYDNDWGHLLWIGADSVTPIERIMTFANS